MKSSCNMHREIAVRTMKRQPDFTNMVDVLSCRKPSRCTLFEFYHNNLLYGNMCDAAGLAWRKLSAKPEFSDWALRIMAFRALGYDYVTLSGSDFSFKKKDRAHAQSVSMSGGGLISDRNTFEQYQWNDPKDFSYDLLEEAGKVLPEGMKVIVCGPGGVLENVVALMGYENLCFAIADEPELAQDIFDHVGERLLEHYRLCLQYDCVGAIISNDDWGFKTQTMLSTSDMQCYVIPWHRKIVQAAHDAGRPAILHSCGNLKEVYDGIVNDIGFNGKHSYEDAIQPVEDAYEMLKGRIAVLGGMDLDYICRSAEEDTYRRACAMLELSRDCGGYALGTGNSVPEYVPEEKFLMLVKAALDCGI